MVKLSILIPTTPDRQPFLEKLKLQFDDQLGALSYGYFDGLSRTLYGGDVEVIIWQDNKENAIGKKRKRLLFHAQGDYVAFIDDDDRISDNYFKLVLEGVATGADCCSLKGVITEDGKNPQVFEHSIKYKEYITNCDNEPVRYERYPNHLNCIKSSIAKRFKFQEVNHGEDTDFATQIFKSGLLKTEHYISEILYYYDYRSNK